MSAPRKPVQGEPCTNCGICCIATPCGLGIELGSPEGQSCQFLRWEAGRSRCGALALIVEQAPEPVYTFIRFKLGIGKGCDSGPDPGDHDHIFGMTAHDFIAAGRPEYL